MYSSVVEQCNKCECMRETNYKMPLKKNIKWKNR